jgi:quinol monooxygenase YgiN
MSIIVNIAFTAAEGQRDALVDSLVSILDETRSHDGCEAITFTESPDTPGLLLLVERWASIPQYDAYKTWRRESGTSILGSDLVAGTPKTTYFTILNG